MPRTENTRRLKGKIRACCCYIRTLYRGWLGCHPDVKCLRSYAFNRIHKFDPFVKWCSCIRNESRQTCVTRSCGISVFGISAYGGMLRRMLVMGLVLPKYVYVIYIPSSIYRNFLFVSRFIIIYKCVRSRKHDR